jgi:hypothetical protein
MKLIAIAGNATAGKDTLCRIIMEELEELGQRCKRSAFADTLKDELDGFLKESTGISAWTDDPAQKKWIRPVLAFWGTEFRRGHDPEYWIKKVESGLDPSAVNIVTDLRFKNELSWAKGHGATVVFLHRQVKNGVLVPPANEYERDQNGFLEESADLVATWQTYKDGPEGDSHRRSFVRRNILPLLTLEG